MSICKKKKKMVQFGFRPYPSPIHPRTHTPSRGCSPPTHPWSRAALHLVTGQTGVILCKIFSYQGSGLVLRNVRHSGVHTHSASQLLPDFYFFFISFLPSLASREKGINTQQSHLFFCDLHSIYSHMLNKVLPSMKIIF